MEANIIKSGILEVFDFGNRIFNRHPTQLNLPCKVIVTIYKTYTDFFAVICPLKRNLNSKTRIHCINLKACIIERLSDTLFTIIYGFKCSLIFKISDNENELRLWLKAFSGNDFLTEKILNSFNHRNVQNNNNNNNNINNTNNNCMNARFNFKHESDVKSNEIRRKYSLATLIEDDENVDDDSEDEYDRQQVQCNDCNI